MTPVWVILAVLVTTQATAQEIPCMPHADAVKTLKDKFQEIPVAMGMEQRGGVVEIFASKSGSWSFVITGPTGKSCMMINGQNWERLAVDEEVEDGA